MEPCRSRSCDRIQTRTRQKAGVLFILEHLQVGRLGRVQGRGGHKVPSLLVHGDAAGLWGTPKDRAAPARRQQGLDGAGGALADPRGVPRLLLERAVGGQQIREVQGPSSRGAHGQSGLDGANPPQGLLGVAGREDVGGASGGAGHQRGGRLSAESVLVAGRDLRSGEARDAPGAHAGPGGVARVRGGLVALPPLPLLVLEVAEAAEHAVAALLVRLVDEDAGLAEPQDVGQGPQGEGDLPGVPRPGAGVLLRRLLDGTLVLEEALKYVARPGDVKILEEDPQYGGRAGDIGQVESARVLGGADDVPYRALGGVLPEENPKLRERDPRQLELGGQGALRVPHLAGLRELRSASLAEAPVGRPRPVGQALHAPRGRVNQPQNVPHHLHLQLLPVGLVDAGSVEKQMRQEQLYRGRGGVVAGGGVDHQPRPPARHLGDDPGAGHQLRAVLEPPPDAHQDDVPQLRNGHQKGLRQNPVP
ncbi:hypothetical protein OIY81_1716 [Cryptosporidium canis]|uniref:Uncharacterized protein n=1 Tax=Cryptosporidium canis TaxID=195482 RepID=A0ABQ8P9T7_9CRYT|nr:hypothetical protein OIY81_1716 [Cryptosporidium canis]KAJ1613298.1 hypothetical protein OJ252_1026 [Cryptosporidium canis]